MISGQADIHSLANPDFEQGQVGYKGKFNIIADKPHSGAKCLQQFYEYKDGWNCVQSMEPFMPCQAGDIFELSAWNRNTVGIGDVLMGIRFIKMEKREAKTVSYSWQLVGNNIQEWTQYKLTAKVPPGATAMSVYFKIDASVKDGDVFWDDVTLQKTEEKIPPMVLQPLRSPVIFNSGATELFDVRTNSWVKFSAAEIPFDVQFNQLAIERSLVLDLNSDTGQNVCHRVFPLDSLQKTFSGKMLPGLLMAGKYLLTVSLLHHGNCVMKSERSLYVIDQKYSDAKLPALESSGIDAAGNILVNGQPFSMFFYYHNPLTDDGITNLRRNFGANTAQVWGSDIDALVKKVDLVWRNGVYSWAVLFGNPLYDSKSGKWNDQALLETVNRLKDHPGLIGWDLIDEPDARKTDPTEIRRVYDLIRKVDPKHLIWVNLCLPVKFPEYVAFSDLATYDVYPFPYGSLNTISVYNQAIKDANSGKVKPLLSCLQTYSQPGNRAPTYDEIRAETYLCITHGMKSYMFYAWFDPAPTFSLDQSMELQAYVQSLVAELKEIAPLLASTTPPQPNFEFVQSARLSVLFKKFNGKKYFFVVNPEKKEKNVVIQLPEYTGGKVSQLFTQKINIMNPEKFAPLEVKIYVY